MTGGKKKAGDGVLVRKTDVMTLNRWRDGGAI